MTRTHSGAFIPDTYLYTEVEGVEVRVRRVAETLSDEVLEKMYALEAQKAWHPEFEVVTHDDLLWADAICWGSPTRFGNVTAQMKTVSQAAFAFISLV